LGIYLVVKILIGDFWYWLPAGGMVEILSSFVFRVLVKVVTDFTSIPQLRHPHEVGGLYWAFGFVLTMGSLPLAIVGGEAHLGERAMYVAWTVVKFFVPFSFACFAVFFLNIERKYWGTFWSTQRSKDLTMSFFLEGKSDEMKSNVLLYSRHHWVSIEDKVKDWIGENWASWEGDKPKWFDEGMLASVPAEFIPRIGGARRRETASPHP
jgi:hypothetical protein